MASCWLYTYTDRCLFCLCFTQKTAYDMRISDWSSDACSSDLWSQIGARRLVLLTTAGATPLPDFAFAAGDVLLFGSESAGVPHHVHDAAAARVDRKSVV